MKKVIEVMSWWNDILMWPVEGIKIDELIIDQMISLWNDQLMKWSVDEVTSSWNDQLMKWSVYEMISWWNHHLMKPSVDDMISWWMISISKDQLMK